MEERYPLKEMKDLQNEINRQRIMLTGTSITYSQLQIIRHLLFCNEQNIVVYQKDFENILNIRKSTLSGILDTLEKNHLIVRIQGDEGNIIELAPHIKRCQKDFIEDACKLEKDLLKGVSKDDLNAFYRVLDKMKENLRKELN